MKAWIERHTILSFFVFAYVYSWAIAVPLALQAQQIVPARLPLALHYLTAFGPALAALTIRVLLRRPAPAPPGHFIMQRKQLLGIAQRAEMQSGQPAV